MDPNHIGKQIKQLRLKHGLKQREMAEQLSVASSTISNWENGNRLPSISELSRIAEHFDVSLGRFEVRDTASIEEDRDDVGNVGIRQSIEMFAKPMPVDPPRVILLTASLVTFLIAAATTRLVSLFFLVSGLFLLGLVGVSGLYGLMIRLGVVPKKVLVPLSHKVRLVHRLNHQAVQRRKMVMIIGALIVLLLDLALYTMLFTLFVREGETVLSMLAALYGIGVLAASLFRLKTVFDSQVYTHTIDYHRFNRSSALLAFELPIPLETAALALMVLFVSALDVVPRSGLYIGTVAVAVFTCALIYGLALLHRWFLQEFTVRILDESGKPVNIT